MDFERNILEHINNDDLTDDMLLLNDYFSFEEIKNIILCLGGIRINIPKPSYYKIKAIKNYLKQLNEKELLSINQYKLSKQFNISLDTLRREIKIRKKDLFIKK